MQRGTGKLAVAVEPHPGFRLTYCPMSQNVSLVIVPYGGVADIGLSSYRPVRRRVVVSSSCTLRSKIECTKSAGRRLQIGKVGGTATERSVGTQANVGHTAYGTMTGDTFYNIGQ